MAADLRERVARANCRACYGNEDSWQMFLNMADAVLAELGLTQAEPVAWRYKVGGEWHASSRPPTAVAMWNDIEEVVPLYAAPQPQAGLLEQHARDSAELRRLCDERDRYRNEARGLRDALTDALENNESLRLAASSAPPRPQASAEPTISEVLAEYERQTKELPCQHEVPERGCCSYNWRMAIIGELRAIADEAKRIRASLGVGRE